MTDQERYIQILEREIAYLRIKLHSVRRLLDEAYGLADPSFAVTDPDMQVVLQDRIEEVLAAYMLEHNLIGFTQEKIEEVLSDAE